MPKHIWFKETPLKHNSRHRHVDAVNKFIQRGSTFRGPPPLANYRTITNAGSSRLRYGNYITALYCLSDIAKIFKISASTVSRWFTKGLLPEPFIHGKGQSTWGKRVPYYTKEQILVICKVLNDIYGQNSCQFREDHDKHIQMMHDGCRIALKRIGYKAVPV